MRSIFLISILAFYAVTSLAGNSTHELTVRSAECIVKNYNQVIVKLIEEQMRDHFQALNAPHTSANMEKIALARSRELEAIAYNNGILNSPEVNVMQSKYTLWLTDSSTENFNIRNTKYFPEFAEKCNF